MWTLAWLGLQSARGSAPAGHTFTASDHSKTGNDSQYVDDENTHVVLPLYNAIQENITSLAG